ncbi:MAG: DUF1611 domain-containing protein [Parvularculaceae bacterium]
MSFELQPIKLRAPYLVFAGGETDPTYAKTAFGIVQWRPELCIGQMRLSAAAVDLGLEDLTPAEAAARGAGSMIIGVANVGGVIPENWLDAMFDAARAGLDIVAGLHTPLEEAPGLAEAAAKSGARLVNVRVPPKKLPVGSGRKRGGRRVLTVGTDCAVGKKYTALQLERDMRAAGMDAQFRASGQTGIMIAGEGLPIDAVVSDFLSGAAEILSPENDPDHWDVIEGQGGIFHPGYAAVSCGLLIGSQPDAVVICHEAGRRVISGWEHFPLPTIGEVIERTIEIGRLTNPEIRAVGVSVNTSSLPPAERDSYLKELSDQYDLPAVDPLKHGTGAIVEELTRAFG